MLLCRMSYTASLAAKDPYPASESSSLCLGICECRLVVEWPSWKRGTRSAGISLRSSDLRSTLRVTVEEDDDDVDEFVDVGESDGRVAGAAAAWRRSREGTMGTGGARLAL